MKIKLNPVNNPETVFGFRDCVSSSSSCILFGMSMFVSPSMFRVAFCCGSVVLRERFGVVFGVGTLVED